MQELDRPGKLGNMGGRRIGGRRLDSGRWFVSGKISKPVCTSTGPEGCVKCSYNYSCHDRRLGRHHLAWPLVALVVLAGVGLIAQV